MSHTRQRKGSLDLSGTSCVFTVTYQRAIELQSCSQAMQKHGSEIDNPMHAARATKVG